MKLEACLDSHPDASYEVDLGGSQHFTLPLQQIKHRIRRVYLEVVSPIASILVSLLRLNFRPTVAPVRRTCGRSMRGARTAPASPSNTDGADCPPALSLLSLPPHRSVNSEVPIPLTTL